MVEATSTKVSGPPLLTFEFELKLNIMEEFLNVMKELRELRTLIVEVEEMLDNLHNDLARANYTDFLSSKVEKPGQSLEGLLATNIIDSINDIEWPYTPI
jgi:hypothetical protein